MSVGFLRQMISYSDLCGDEPSIDVARDILKDFKLSSIVEMIARLNFRLFKEGYETDIQKWLVCELLDVEMRKKVLRELVKPDRIVFSRMQLLKLLQVACSVCDEDGYKTFENEKHRFEFGRSALIVNDYLDDNDVDTIIKILPYLIRSLDLNNFPRGADIVHPMVRWYAMLSDVPEKAGEFSGNIDIDSLMNTIYGMSLEKYYSLIFATFLYINKLEIKDLMTNPSKFLIDTTSFLNVPGITNLSKQYSKLKPDIIDLSEIRQKIQETDCCYPEDSFMTFRQYPLVRFSINRVICIDLGFLIDKLSSGIHWTLHRLLSERSGKDVKEFMTYRGELFEVYVDDLLRDTYPESPVVLTHYLSSPKDFEDSDYGDGIIYSEDNRNIAFLEYKSSLLKVEAKYGGSSKLLADEIEMKFVEKGVSQLAQKIANFADVNADYAKKPIRGVNRTDVRDIFPMLVTLEPAMRTPFMNTYLDEKFREKLGNHTIDSRFHVHPLILLIIDDLERLIPYLSSRGTWKCLQNYITDKYYYSGFSIYIKKELYCKDGFQQSPFIKQKFDKIRAEIMTALSKPQEVIQ